MTLQHQGALAAARNQLDSAARLYQQALDRFREANDQGEMMRSYNLLGVAEQTAGRPAEARAWYERSRELAMHLKDQPSLSVAAQNIGVVVRGEGEAARERGDEPAARRHFEEALRWVDESLRIDQALGNKPGEASSRGLLARIHLRLGDLDAAERQAHEARKIRESLGLLEADRDYDNLSDIARARGDLTAAHQWEQKRDALDAERKRRAGGSGSLPAKML
jgi:tetratricopeptide (TPR) repeat protein